MTQEPQSTNRDSRSLFIAAIDNIRLGVFYHGMDKPVSVLAKPMRQVAFSHLYRRYLSLDQSTRLTVESFLSGQLTCLQVGGVVYLNEALCGDSCHRGDCVQSARAAGAD